MRSFSFLAKEGKQKHILLIVRKLYVRRKSRILTIFYVVVNNAGVKHTCPEP